MIGHSSVVTQKKIRPFIKRYCNDFDVKLVFFSFKIGNLLGVKDPIPDELRSCVAYKFKVHVRAVICLLSRRNNPAFFHTRA